jgi:HK97 family phage portal protein
MLAPQSAAPGPIDDFWYQPVGGAVTSSGMRVTADSALTESTTYACVKVLAEDIAGLPLMLFRRGPGDSRDRAKDHPLYEVLHDRPNSFQSAFEWRELLMNWATLRGNAYSEIVPGARGFVDELIPLHPDRVTPKLLRNGRIVYEYERPNPPPGEPRKRTIDAGRMFHLRGTSLDGVKGISVVEAAVRDYIGKAQAEHQYTSRFFSQDARPGGVLKHPNTLSEEAHSRLKQSWASANSGVENAHKVAILEEGLDFQAVGLSNRDAQLVDSAKLTATQIAQFFRMQLHKVQLMHEATFSNIEMQSIEHVTDTIRPWATRWEQAILRQLIPESQRGELFAEFIMEDLIRGDIKSQVEALNLAVNGGGHGGMMTVNEARRRLNMPPIEGGDTLVGPNNGGGGAEPAASADPAPASEFDRPYDEAFASAMKQARRIAEASAERLVRKEVAALRKAAERRADATGGMDWPGFLTDAERFYAGHDRFVAETLQVSIETARHYARAQLAALATDGLVTLEQTELHGARALADMSINEIGSAA